MRKSAILLLGVCLALVVAVPSQAAAPGPVTAIDSVPAGFDFWQTLGSGATQYSFQNDPLPAGFFCRGSKAFTGTISFEGVPLASDPPGILGTTDTILERLDEAVFNQDGLAQSRVVIRALQLRGIDQVTTSCGAWTAAAGLAGDQPVSHMTFRRTSKLGGEFDADLRIKVNVVFTNVRSGETRQITRLVHLPTSTATAFTCQARPTTVNTVSPARVHLVDQSTAIGVSPAPSPTPIDIDVNGCIVGRQCETVDHNGNGRLDCMYVYSWHDPLASGNEAHFTHTPCQLGYRQFCTVDADPNFEAQLEELHNLGYIDVSPAEALREQKKGVAERLRGKN